MRTIFVICAALLTAQCATTPTVEDVNAQRAKMENDCKAKGYAPGTQDFETCYSLAAQENLQQQLKSTVVGGAGLTALAVAPLLLSDVRAKRDIELLATLASGIHLYRFCYRSSEQVYVGVIAQDVQRVMPQAVVKGSDGLLRVNYAALGLKLMTWEQWAARRKSAPPG